MKTKIKIDFNGAKARLYAGRDLICVFKYSASKGAYWIVFQKPEMAEHFLLSPEGTDYLNLVLKELEKYREKARQLEFTRIGTENFFNGLFEMTIKKTAI